MCKLNNFFLAVHNKLNFTLTSTWNTSHDHSTQPFLNQNSSKASYMSSSIKMMSSTLASERTKQREEEEEENAAAASLLHRYYLRMARNVFSNLQEFHDTIWCFITESNAPDLQTRFYVLERKMPC